MRRCFGRGSGVRWGGLDSVEVDALLAGAEREGAVVLAAYRLHNAFGRGKGGSREATADVLHAFKTPALKAVMSSLML